MGCRQSRAKSDDVFQNSGDRVNLFQNHSFPQHSPINIANDVTRLLKSRQSDTFAGASPSSSMTQNPLRTYGSSNANVPSMSFDMNLNLNCDEANSPLYKTVPMTPAPSLNRSFSSSHVLRKRPSAPTSDNDNTPHAAPNWSVNIVNTINFIDPFSHSQYDNLGALKQQLAEVMASDEWCSKEVFYLFNGFQRSLEMYRLNSSVAWYIFNSLKALNEPGDPYLSLLFDGSSGQESYSGASTFRDPEIMCLCELVKYTNRLDFLSITKANVSFGAFAQFGDALIYNRSLVSLELPFNNLEDAEIATVMRGISTGSVPLQRLNLRSNKISDVGLFAISRYLLSDKVRLTFLDLSDNKFTVEGIKSIIYFLNGYAGLERLSLVSNYYNYRVENPELLEILTKIDAEIEASLNRTYKLENFVRSLGKKHAAFISMMKEMKHEKYNKGLECWMKSIETEELEDNSHLSTGSASPPRRSSLLDGLKRISLKGKKKVDASTTNHSKHDEETKDSTKHRLSFGFFASKGRRNQMQDFLLCANEFRGKPNRGVFAVFDGHGGVECGKFVRANFECFFKAELEKNEKLPFASEEELVKVSMRNAFEQMQQIIKAHEIAHGTCALVLYFRDDRIFAANAGDSQAITFSLPLIKDFKPLQKQSEASQLQIENQNSNMDSGCPTSQDQPAVKVRTLSTIMKPSNPAETKRIEEAGGFVIRDRVDGVIAVSRALGDTVHQPKVNFEPTLQMTSLKNSEDATGYDMVVMASDGFWDVVRPDEVVSLIIEELSRMITCGEVIEESLDEKSLAKRCWDLAKHLVNHAASKQSNDNISVLCIVNKKN